MPRRHDRIAAVVALPGQKQHGPRILPPQVFHGRAGNGITRALHQFRSGNARSDAALVQLPNLFRRNRFHSRSV
jgi:hypothetical protein